MRKSRVEPKLKAFVQEARVVSVGVALWVVHSPWSLQRCENRGRDGSRSFAERCGGEVWPLVGWCRVWFCLLV